MLARTYFSPYHPGDIAVDAANIYPDKLTKVREALQVAVIVMLAEVAPLS
jgi:hypothetical protein